MNMPVTKEDNIVIKICLPKEATMLKEFPRKRGT